MLSESPTRDTPWQDFHRRWQRLTPPLRPHADVCAAFAGLIADHRTQALLLGVTPEISRLAARTVAVDCSHNALARIWPGNAPGRHAIHGNWLSLPLASGSCSAVIGDGSLNCLTYPSGYIRVFDHLARVLRPGGRAVLRVYLTPERGEPLSATRRRVMAGGVTSIHALKWRVANAVCAERGQANIAVRSIFEAFERTFPNRAAVRRATGWTDEDIAQVDAYEHMPDVFSFPTLPQLLAVVPAGFAERRIVATQGYELAGRCPLLVMDARP